jgi:methylated-DNA-protein-cysteine methyltransferase-like protein
MGINGRCVAAMASGSSRAEIAVEFAEQVYRIVRAVPHGRVVSYGGVAALLGRPRAARGVGHALHALRDGTDVPWWRVVNRNGEISIRSDRHGPVVQRALLVREGVRFDRAGRIDWTRFGWSADELPRASDGSIQYERIDAQ